MKLQYIATVAAVSILTIGGATFASNTAFASTPQNDVSTSTLIAGNPCAAAHPCAAANPCAVANPYAAANPCAGK